MISKLKRAWTNASLRTKWFYSIAVTILSVYTVICVIIYAALFAWLSENEKNNALRTVDDLQSYFSSQSMRISVNDLQQQTGLMQAIVSQEQTVRLYALDGTELLRINDFSSETALVNTTTRTMDERVVDDTDVYVVQDVITVGRTAVILQLIHPLTSFQAMMRYILTTMLIMALGALLISAVVSHLLASHFVKPLQQLATSMGQVKERGVGGNTLTIEPRSDELGEVVHMYNAMLRQLDEAFQRQQQFVFDASHELRTPIQAIEGNLKLLQRWGKDNPEVLEESLAISIEEIERMKKLMEELLVLARQQQAEDVAPILVAPILQQLKLDYAPYVTIDDKSEQAAVVISEEALRQILRNLIENSIRYCQVEPSIEVRAEQLRDECCIITVQDNGIGIDEVHLPYIFDRFYKADDARLHVEGSTGLGLSIVKMLVGKYDGVIDVMSEKDKGTVINVQLPIKK